MKKLKTIVSLSILIGLIILFANQYVFAKSSIDIDKFISKVEFSDKYKKWLVLSESQKQNVLQPKIYDDLNTPFINTNPLYEINLLGASLKTSYDLRDVIKDNVTIKNQQSTKTCWAFASLSSLETNFALKNINNNKVYDFSERHVNYATARTFLNGENKFGYNRGPNVGGQWLLVESYLTNGQGAVEEAQMPFENNSNLINLEDIKRQEVQTRVYDTVYFDNYNYFVGTVREDKMNQVKQHIQDYGSVYASIHGDSSDVEAFSCYRNDTGAKYCDTQDSHDEDHAVSIIGWDDNYSVDNFAEGCKPSANGAWIVRNSWGESVEYDLAEFKQRIFNESREDCISLGWNSASEIPNQVIEEAGFKISGNSIILPIGDNGYMYVSYEDCNIGENLYGISKAIDSVDYDYIYQYNELYPAVEITVNAESTFLCNIFDKQSSGQEYLTGVSLTAPETYTCKVLVNPNGTSKAKEDMQFVKLKAGDTQTIDKGYHTLEFAEPLEITGKNFVVIIEIEGTRPTVNVLLEGKGDGNDLLDCVTTETDKCFLSTTTDFDTCTWIDLGRLEESSSRLTNGDNSIKAFSVTKVVEEPVIPDKPGITEEPEEPEKPITPEEKPTVEYPKTSNFSNAKCKIPSMKAYYYPNNSSKDYSLINTEITGISKGLNNDSYEYYYYISSNSSLSNISDWVKIDKAQIENNKLNFEIDTRDVLNYNEKIQASKLYIYIKEKVVKGENESFVVSKALNFDNDDTLIEIFVNDVKQIEYNNAEKNPEQNQAPTQNQEQNQEKNKAPNQVQGDNGGNPSSSSTTKQPTDSTTSPINLPHTGAGILILVIIMVIIIVGLIVFVKYEILNKYIK